MLFASILTGDFLFGHRLRDPLLFWSFGVLTLSMTLFLTFSTYHRSLRERLYEIAFSTLLVNGCALIAISAVTRWTGDPLPLAWTLLILTYIFVSTGMPYRTCVPLGIGLGLLDLVVAFAERLPASALSDHVLLVVSVVTMGVIACAMLERSDRFGWMRAQQMQAQSHSDQLTGLRNRRYLFEEGAHRIGHASREDTPVALLMVDVDYFKRYNDALGHPAGDLCLREVSTTLMESTRHPLDITTRLGGEEFALLLFSCERANAMRAAERLRAEVEARNIPHPTAPAGRVTVSIGVAASDVTGTLDLDSLLLAADKGLYRAKEAGRNAVSF